MKTPFEKSMPGTPSASDGRIALVRQAFRIEWFTIAWMSVEGVVAITSGVVAHSVPLTAFGVDSVIELLSAGVLLWRLTDELRRGAEFSHRTERTAGGPVLSAI